MSIVFNICGSTKQTSNNNAHNLRITQTPKAIRNNLYNLFTNKFTNQPEVISYNLNNQKNSTIFIVGKNYYYTFTNKSNKI